MNDSEGQSPSSCENMSSTSPYQSAPLIFALMRAEQVGEVWPCLAQDDGTIHLPSIMAN
jgi:hypothetical protein